MTGDGKASMFRAGVEIDAGNNLVGSVRRQFAVVDLQRADLAGAFGGGGSQTAFGTRGAATFLTKLTTSFAVLFMLTTITLSVISFRASNSSGESVLDEIPASAGVPAETGGEVPTSGDDLALCGTVTLDGESDHSGVLVELVGEGLSTTTDVSGYYEFPAIFGGDYTVNVSKEHWHPQSAVASVPSGGSLTGFDFTLQFFDRQVPLDRDQLAAADDGDPARQPLQADRLVAGQADQGGQPL